MSEATRKSMREATENLPRGLSSMPEASPRGAWAVSPVLLEDAPLTLLAGVSEAVARAVEAGPGDHRSPVVIRQARKLAAKVAEVCQATQRDDGGLTSRIASYLDDASIAGTPSQRAPLAKGLRVASQSLAALAAKRDERVDPSRCGLLPMFVSVDPHEAGDSDRRTLVGRPVTELAAAYERARFFIAQRTVSRRPGKRTDQKTMVPILSAMVALAQAMEQAGVVPPDSGRR